MKSIPIVLMENDFGVNGSEVNLNDLISELLQGRDAANRLHMGLNNAPPLSSPPSSSSSSQESCEVLINKVLSSLDNALYMLNHAGRNESSDSDHEVRDASGRRRKAPLWTHQVHVSPGADLEEAHDDGYNWRKYGQKKILGAKFPKGYYRCTHLHSQGCLAKKQIQKSDDDPTVFNVCYRGSHTCNPNPLPSLPLRPQPQPATLENQEPSMVQIQQEDNLLNLRRNLKGTTDNLEASSHGHDNSFPSFKDFASSSGIDKVGEIDCGFLQPQTMVGNSSVESIISPCFVSPGTSGSSCFTTTSSTTTTTHVNNVGGTQYVVSSEVEMEILTARSGTNSPVVGMGFSFDAAMGFDFDFTFDNNNNPGFFD